jgi:hypothetical protein
MNPFVYPKSEHIRREKPGALSPYPRYKPFLRREFERKCIYCRMPDSMKDIELYGVEHYRPKGRFPGLITSYSNLFYACNPCNRRKGEYWPTRGKGKTHFVPNPCDQQMYKHLRFNGPVVEVKSTAGQVARELLDLNDPEAVAYRKFILEAIETYSKKKTALENTRQQLTQLRAQGSVSVVDADAGLASLDHDLNIVTTNLARLAGQ